jgi:hypothetical protein
MDMSTLFPEEKQLGDKTDHSSPNSTEVKNVW